MIIVLARDEMTQHNPTPMCSVERKRLVRVRLPRRPDFIGSPRKDK